MFRKLLLRNLIAMIIPILIILTLVLVTAEQLSLLDAYRCYNLSDTKLTEVAFLEGKQNVSVVCPDNLLPAGYNYKVDDEVIGYYYYSMDKSSMSLYVLSKKTVSKLKSGESGITITARIEEDEVTSRYIEEEFNDTVGLNSDTMSGYVDKYIINEMEYPETQISILAYIKLGAVILISITILYFILAILYPTLNFSFSNKGIASSRAQLIDEMNEELEERLDEKSRNVYITDNFIITANISYIDIEKRTF